MILLCDPWFVAVLVFFSSFEEVIGHCFYSNCALVVVWLSVFFGYFSQYPGWSVVTNYDIFLPNSIASVVFLGPL